MPTTRATLHGISSVMALKVSSEQRCPRNGGWPVGSQISFMQSGMARGAERKWTSKPPSKLTDLPGGHQPARALGTMLDEIGSTLMALHVPLNVDVWIRLGGRSPPCK
ncbi:uncharacterized protein LOC120426053 isoform X2 [Culex pipiens pallens]|uniref:uncharacterized protein LOC120426053 isoform X2 n=1 Tax=Culex pipiens pallens TaxID=42434 RepID=UPI0019531CCE|nr:uncharacterized protein LOC120426053 isoform X2 [Culex pipiens pallens]